MTETKKNTLTTKSTKPTVQPQRPNIPQFQNKFQKPNLNIPKFNTSFRTQNRGGGGK